MSESSDAGASVVVETPTERLSGRALTVEGVDPAAVAAAVRDGGGGTAPAGRDSGPGALTVTCPEPGPAHEYVGVVGPDRRVRVRTALAAAARSRGLSAPQDDELARVRDRLSAVSVPDSVDTAPIRERLADAAADVERLRERVATLRGRLQAAREAGRDAGDLRAELTDATRALSERETERAAAREALDRAEQRAREARDARERRRRLADRADNLERAARAHLVDALRDEYATAVASVPGIDGEVSVSGNGSGGGGSADGIDAPFAVDPVSAALAVGRVADLSAPVVLVADRFARPDAAADWLAAPVLRVRPG